MKTNGKMLIWLHEFLTSILVTVSLPTSFLSGKVTTVAIGLEPGHASKLHLENSSPQLRFEDCLPIRSQFL
jgi:hypothetical protein